MKKVDMRSVEERKGGSSPSEGAMSSEVDSQSRRDSTSRSGSKSLKTGKFGSHATATQPRSSEKSASGIRSTPSGFPKSVSLPSPTPDYNIPSKTYSGLKGSGTKSKSQRSSLNEDNKSAGKSSPSNPENRRTSFSSSSKPNLKDKTALQQKSKGQGQVRESHPQKPTLKSPALKGIGKKSSIPQRQTTTGNLHQTKRDPLAARGQSKSYIDPIPENIETKEICPSPQNITRTEDISSEGRTDISHSNDEGVVFLSAREQSTSYKEPVRGNIDTKEISNSSQNLTCTEEESFCAANKSERTDLSRTNDDRLASSFGQASRASSSTSNKLALRDTSVSITSISESEVFVTEKSEVDPTNMTQQSNKGIKSKDAIESVSSECNIDSNLPTLITDHDTKRPVRPKSQLVSEQNLQPPVILEDTKNRLKLEHQTLHIDYETIKPATLHENNQNKTLIFEDEINKSLSLENIELEKFGTDKVLKNSSMICDETNAEDSERNLQVVEIPSINVEKLSERKSEGFSGYLRIMGDVMKTILKEKKMLLEFWQFKEQRVLSSLLSADHQEIEFSPLKKRVDLLISKIEKERGEYMYNINQGIFGLLKYLEVVPENKSEPTQIQNEKINKLRESSEKKPVSVNESSKVEPPIQDEEGSKENPSLQVEKLKMMNELTHERVNTSDEHLTEEEIESTPKNFFGYVEEPNLLTNVSAELSPWTNENKINLAAEICNKPETLSVVEVTLDFELSFTDEISGERIVTRITDVWAAYATGKKIGIKTIAVNKEESQEESVSLDVDESFIIERNDDFPYTSNDSNSKYRSENLNYFSKSDFYENAVRKEEGIEDPPIALDDGSGLSLVLKKFEDYAPNFRENTAYFFESFENNKNVSLDISNLEETIPCKQDDLASEATEDSSDHSVATFYINENGKMFLLNENYFGEPLDLERNEERKELLNKILKISAKKRLNKRALEISDFTRGGLATKDINLLKEVLSEAFSIDLKSNPKSLKPIIGDINIRSPYKGKRGDFFTFYVNESGNIFALTERYFGKRLILEGSEERKRVLSKIIEISKRKRFYKRAIDFSDLIEELEWWELAEFNFAISELL